MITREALVTQSVTDWAKQGLVDAGYDESLWKWEEAFNAERMAAWDRTVVAAGFNFDDGGHQAELGSNLRVRTYHIELYVFGKTLTLGQNIAGVLQQALEREMVIPLFDYGVIPPAQVDALQVLSCPTHRITPSTHPEPWEEFAYVTAVQVEDYFAARLV